MKEWFANKWERAVMALVAVLAITVAVLLISKTLSFGDRFELTYPRPNDNLPSPNIPGLQVATKETGKVHEWTLPKFGHMQPSLIKSTYVIQQAGRVIDPTNPEHPMIRPPIENQWWLDYDLSAEMMFENAKMRDYDKDGFSNEAEFIGKSDPTDPNSFPPRTDKLFLARRDAEEYKLEFSSYVEPKFNIRCHTGGKNSWWVEMGQEFDPDKAGKNRFKLINFKKKEEVNPNTGAKQDVSEITLSDLRGDQPSESKLTYRAKTDLPIYYAVFKYLLDTGNEFPVKLGDTFTLPNTTEKYKVLAITEGEALISNVENPEKQIRVPQQQQESQQQIEPAAEDQAEAEKSL